MEVKYGFWKNEIILIEDSKNNIIGSISVLIRKIPIFGNIMYSPRGPICDIHDEDVLTKLKDSIIELAKKYKAFVIKIEPDIKSDDICFKDIVKKIGYKIREAQLQKTPYMLIIGDKEVESNGVGVRSRKDGDIGQMSVEDFISKISKEIETFAR